jgi:hypothetical protein
VSRAQLLAPPSPHRMLDAYCEADARFRALGAQIEKLTAARRRLAGAAPARIERASNALSRAVAAQDRRRTELAVQLAAAAKPWEMTRAAWQRELESLAYDPSGARMPRNHHQAGHYVLARLARKRFLRGYLPDRTREDGAPLEWSAPAGHRDVVAQALVEGHAVPAEVLADYPDLVEQLGAEHTLAIAVGAP